MSAEVKAHAEGVAGDTCPSCRIGLWSPGHVHYTDAEHREHIAHVAAGAAPVALCILCANPPSAALDA